MRLIKQVTLTIILAFTLFSCVQTGVVLPSATGTRYEILVVMDEAAWKAPAGRAVVALLDQDMDALPQPEPVMSIHYVQPSVFGDILKPSRNILFVEIDARFEQPKIVYATNKWSQPQSVVRVQVKNEDILEKLIAESGEKILDYFLTTERNRYIALSKTNLNLTAQREIEDIFGISIDIPNELTKISKGDDFYWITNDHPGVRKDMIIYSYPYRDKNTFTLDYLIAKRDSIMKTHIHGEFEGSYMGTELTYHQPTYKAININNTYCAEVKGLWRMYGGGSMGGPFYSHTRVDEANKRVITVEGFVFAPGAKKRNHIRQLEAAIYTTKLPQEMNVIKEVSVVSTSTSEE